MADLEANLMHLQLMHESLSRFGESFASFLYGLNMNAFVVDFPEVRLTEPRPPGLICFPSDLSSSGSYHGINQALAATSARSSRSKHFK